VLTTNTGTLRQGSACADNRIVRMANSGVAMNANALRETRMKTAQHLETTTTGT